MKTTGYFSTQWKPRTLVHAVEDGKPVCGCRSKGEFQFCAHGFLLRYIECLNCRRIVSKETPDASG